MPDLDAAEQLLQRAWEHRGDDARLAATIAQRRAFMASSRLRGAAAIEWAQRAIELMPGDTGTALLAAPSLADGLAFEGRVDEAHAVLADFQRLLVADGVVAGYAQFEPGQARRLLLHPQDRVTGVHYSLLPMMHAVINDMLSPEQARDQLGLIEAHLLGPDGARLFDRPLPYRGGPQQLFQRAESSAFFGREIGIMYVHAHLRYAEALARVGDGPGLLRALARAVPIGVTDLVPSAAPRQANAYSSSSDGAFADRYQASRHYDQLLAGEVALEAGWRVYSSGPGLFLEVLTQGMLGLRHAGDELELDPVLDPSLGSVSATLETSVGRLRVEIRAGEAGFGPVSVTAGAGPLSVRRLENPYRVGGVAVLADLAWAGASVGAGDRADARQLVDRVERAGHGLFDVGCSDRGVGGVPDDGVGVAWRGAADVRSFNEARQGTASVRKCE